MPPFWDVTITATNSSALRTLFSVASVIGKLKKVCQPICSIGQ